MPERWKNGAWHFFQRVLPRHLQLIYEINVQLMEACERQWPGDSGKKRGVFVD